MAKLDETLDKSLETSPVSAEPKKSMINPKVFLIGLPVFVLQLIVVYFVTANILLSKIENHQQPGNSEQAATEVEDDAGENQQDTAKQNVELGKYVFSIVDIIVNPAGTNGQRLMLTDIGVDLGSQEQLDAFKSKEVVVKDIIVSILSGKNLGQLSNSLYKDTLKTEITKSLLASFPKTKINNVYFSKYIIQ